MSMPMPQPNPYGAPQMSAYPVQPNLQQNFAPPMNAYPNVQQNFAPPPYAQQQQDFYNQGQQQFAPQGYGMPPQGYNPNMAQHQQYMPEMSNYPQQHQVIMQQPTYQQQPNVQIIQQGAVGAHPQVINQK